MTSFILKVMSSFSLFLSSKRVVFSWSVISCVTREEPELLTHIRDFTALCDSQTQVLRMVRVVYRE